MSDFVSILIHWYQKNKRPLPWRETKNPYHIWLSEVILQQTRIDQGTVYYEKFTEQYPDIYALAAASPDDVLKLWQGLGYYNRANNLMVAAKTIVEEYGGEFPLHPDELIKIKGIGKYTSAAIASIAFDFPAAVVDGNVFRVLSRVFGIETAINSNAGFREFESLATKLMAKHSPSIFNQALMEFGALFCTPKNPDCSNCIFRQMCFAFKNNKIGDLPVKNPAVKVKNRHISYYVVESKGKIPQMLIRKRIQKDIWRNLYDFPSIESDQSADPLEILFNEPDLKFITNQPFTVKHLSETYFHLLTHRKIHARFCHIIVDKLPQLKDEKSLLLINKKDIINYPVPRLIEKYLTARNLI